MEKIKIFHHTNHYTNKAGERVVQDVHDFALLQYVACWYTTISLSQIGKLYLTVIPHGPLKIQYVSTHVTLQYKLNPFKLCLSVTLKSPRKKKIAIYTFHSNGIKPNKAKV